MLSERLPSRRALQQLTLVLICALTSAISVFMTLRFCWRIFPDERQLCLAIGIAWELSKLCFTAVGSTDIRDGGSRLQRGRRLLALSGVLSLGSVAASTGYLLQTQANNHHATVASSCTYNDAVGQLKSIDIQLELLTTSAGLSRQAPHAGARNVTNHHAEAARTRASTRSRRRRRARYN